MGKFRRFHTQASILTAEQVLEIRERYWQQNWTQGALARHYGVAVGTIGRIVRGESWQGLGGPGTHEAATEKPAAQALLEAAEDRIIEQSISHGSSSDAAAAASLKKLLEMGIEVTQGEAAAPTAEAGGDEDIEDTPTGEL